VGVDNDVRVNVSPVRVPGLRANETIRDSNRQSLGSLADLSEGGLVVLVQVGDAVLGLTEVVESRQRLVDEGDSVTAAVGLAKDVVGGSADHFDGKIEGCLVVPPSELASLALVVETVLTARKTVQVDDDVHVVLADGVLGNLLHGQLLATSVVVVTCDGGHIGPVTDGNAESVDTVGGEVVDVLGGDVGVVTVLKQSTALYLAQSLTEAVLVDGARCVVVEEARLNVLLKNEPATEVNTVRLVVSPSGEGVGSWTGPLRASPVDDDLLNLDEDLRSDLEEVDERTSGVGRTKESEEVSLGESRGIDGNLRNVVQRQTLSQEVGRGQEFVTLHRLGGEKSRTVRLKRSSVNDLRRDLDGNGDVDCGGLSKAGCMRDILGRADRSRRSLNNRARRLLDGSLRESSSQTNEAGGEDGDLHSETDEEDEKCLLDDSSQRRETAIYLYQPSPR